MTPKWPICLLAPLFFAGCVSSKIQQGGTPGAGQQAASIYLAPYHNATPNPTAGRALTDITATSLMAHGLPLVQSETANAQAAVLLDEGKHHDMLDVAKSVNASHALLCSVHEYRFKSDLDGAPTVGITMRLVETFSGSTVWQGTGSRAGSYYGSLSKTAQNTIDKLVREMSGRGKRRSVRTRRETVVHQPVQSPPAEDRSFTPVYRNATTYDPALAAPVAPVSAPSTAYVPPVAPSPPPAYSPGTTAAPAAANPWDPKQYQKPLYVPAPETVTVDQGKPAVAEPEFEQIRRRAPKNQPVTALPPDGAAAPGYQPAPVRGRYDPIYTPAPQPAWNNRSN